LYSKVLFIEKNYNQVIKILGNNDNQKLISPIHWLLLGDSYMELGDNEQALDVFTRWLKVQPQYRVAWLRKISLQEKLENYSSALSTTNSALKLSLENVDFKLLRVHFLILTRDFLQAQHQLNDLSESQQDLPLAKGLQAKIWLTEGKFKKAIPGLENLYEQMPNSYNAALVFAALKKIEQEDVGFNFIKKHVKRFPDDYAISTVLAESAVKFDKGLAKTEFTKLLSRSPNDLSIINNLAWVEYELGNLSSANKLVDRALAINSSHPKVLDTAALIKLKLGKKDEAIELFKEAIRLAPDDAEIAENYQNAIK